MSIELSPTDCRILGALVEKELTTPEYYPLSLNALLNACNQKSNRQPVMALDEGEVSIALDHLRHLGLAMQSGEGGRVAKFCHALPGKLHLDEKELAILAELLLRGAQTPGEIRARADRMTRLDNLETTETVLRELIEREVPLVTKLPRQPGRKENRYMHLLGSEEITIEDMDDSTTSGVDHKGNASAGRLAEEVASLREELSSLRNDFDEFRKQFD